MKKNTITLKVNVLISKKEAVYEKNNFFLVLFEGKNAKAMSLIDSILTARLSFKEVSQDFV